MTETHDPAVAILISCGIDPDEVRAHFEQHHQLSEAHYRTLAAAG